MISEQVLKDSTLLEALAARCEQATGQDRTIDREVFDIVATDHARFTYQELAVCSPSYTASVDAALTLVPEGWVIGSIGEEKPGEEWVAELRRGHRTSYDKVVLSDCTPGKRCKTLALAITAAALRAHAASQEMSDAA